MKAVIIIRPNSEFSRRMDEISSQITGEVQFIDPDTIDGTEFSRAHDVTIYPTVLVLTDDGSEIYRETENFNIEQINHNLTRSL